MLRRRETVGVARTGAAEPPEGLRFRVLGVEDAGPDLERGGPGSDTRLFLPPEDWGRTVITSKADTRAPLLSSTIPARLVRFLVREAGLENITTSGAAVPIEFLFWPDSAGVPA